MTPWITAAVVAAAAGSPHCLGMCGALACAAGDRPAQHGAYHLGRIGTYAALGASAGWMGRAIPGPAWLGTSVAAVFLIGFAASLAGLLPEPRVAVPGLAAVGARVARRADLPSRVVFGAVNGLLPCGLVYATLSLAVATADPLTGAAVMATFGAATVPILLAATFGLRRLIAGSVGARRALAVVVLISGLGTLGMRSGWFSPPGADPTCHQPQQPVAAPQLVR
ncbi:MAG: sulfite exporter TauE/SafE family protein [Myxococcota bacterium]